MLDQEIIAKIIDNHGLSPEKIFELNRENPLHIEFLECSSPVDLVLQNYQMNSEYILFGLKKEYISMDDIEWICEQEGESANCEISAILNDLYNYDPICTVEVSGGSIHVVDDASDF